MSFVHRGRFDGVDLVVILQPAFLKNAPRETDPEILGFRKELQEQPGVRALAFDNAGLAASVSAWNSGNAPRERAALAALVASSPPGPGSRWSSEDSMT